MTINPPSFRMPFQSQIEALPEEHQVVWKNCWSAITDLQSAIPVLKSTIDSAVQKSTSSSTTTGTSTSSAVTAAQATGIAKAQALKAIYTLLGNTNAVSGDYTTSTSDYGSVIASSASSASTVTLSASVQPQFFSSVQNLGSAAVTLQPGSGGSGAGTINGASSLTLPPGYAVQVFFDGKNWTASGLVAVDFATINGMASPTQIPPLASLSGSVTATQVPALSALSGAVTPAQVPALSSLSGSIATSQLPAAGVSGNVTLAQLTPTGTQGSLTVTNGIITSITNPS
jgi:hypothetical protein